MVSVVLSEYKIEASNGRCCLKIEIVKGEDSIEEGGCIVEGRYRVIN